MRDGHSSEQRRPPATPKELLFKDDLLTVDLSPPPMRVTDEEMALNQIPLYARDCCVHWLIEMKRCQRSEYFIPWKCQTEKHNYEACVLQDIMRRQKIKMREKLIEEQQQQRASSEEQSPS